jgi:serine/threonine protein kinase/tetratricopeptide (TPR) repeat protein
LLNSHSDDHLRFGSRLGWDGRSSLTKSPEMGYEDHLRVALADRYEIEREIGSGGMATVYVAEDLKHHRKVAVKVLRPELSASLGVERFVREIEIAANLTHPHILPLFDSGDAGGFLYYVMPFIEGESLRDRFMREQRLSVPDAVGIIDQVASALSHAHERGLVHRDIKPENILLAGDQAIVADFGIARAVEAAGGARLTGTGIAVGTPAYMSPEQAAGDTNVDGRSDVYALGCVLYEMVSGRPPFEAPTPQALLLKHVVDTAPNLHTLDPNIPLFVERAVSRALAKEPAGRFKTPKDLAATLTSRTVVAPEGKSIVVLPFQNLSPDPDQAYFSDGLAEELIADLSKVRALRVISRTSAMLLKGSKKDLPTIARELNVRYVLEGSVRWAGNNLRITAQLIEATTDAHLWADKYTGTLEDVFDLQEQMSRRIVEALKVTLTPDEDRHLASRDIPDAEAYALYIRARQELLKMTEESFDLAEQLLERALARTGPNALLLATAAEIAYSHQDLGYRPAAETLDRGDALATRALELNPNLAEAHVAKGLIAQRRFDTPACVRHFQRAVDLDPADGMAAWAAAFCLAEVGRTDEARRHGDRARAVDPLFWAAQFGSALADLCDGNFKAAHAKFGRMHTISGDNPVAKLWLGVSLAYAGRPDEASASLDQAAAAGVGIFSATATVFGAMVSGDREAMRKVLIDPGTREALEMTTELTWMVAAASAAVSDIEEALYWLSRSIEMGFINHRFFAEQDPFLAKLRGDPRFEELMERAREKQREIEAEA